MRSIEDKILARIIRRGRGSVITNRDFWEYCYNSASVDWCLYRLKPKEPEKLFSETQFVRGWIRKRSF